MDASCIERFPRMPGVYLMKDGTGQVIYVGKAKDLRARVRSYFFGGDGRSQIEFLLKRVEQIDQIVTDSENQAFVLERDLINKYKPRYNIRLKDDKAFLNIRVDENAPWPRLELVRRVEQDGARYFGPYSFSYELRTVLDIINRAIPLRTCTDTVFYNRQRPCLEYEIKRCAGPCSLPVDKAQYQTWVEEAIAILEGNTQKVAKDLERQMTRASAELRYEDAATLRDRLDTLKTFSKGQAFNSSGAEDRDVFSLYREGSLAVLSVLVVRLGRISDSLNFSFSNVQVSDGEVLESALTQFYEGGREIPPEIIVPLTFENLSLVRNVLKEKRGSALDFIVPERGIKARLLKLALLNAKQQFVTSFDKEARYTAISKQIAQLANLKQLPRRIECVDISNFQGSDIVGAVVSFFDGEPDKSRYRKYRLKHSGKPDDFATINEVVSRHIRRALEEHLIPDLLIIDGGLGQLGAAISAREELSAVVDIFALAKMRTEAGVRKKEIEKIPERIFVEGAREALMLDPTKELTHFIQRIRDEAHRFVITFHRSTRAKRVFRSVLDEIPGVGPERRGRLLRAYGSVSNMAKVSAEELARTGRMPKRLAEKVLGIINQRGS